MDKNKFTSLYIVKLLFFLTLLFISINAFAEVADLNHFVDIEKASLNAPGGGDIITTIGSKSLGILKIVKNILLGVFVIFMVYTGIMMITSRGSDEEELSKAKRQIWYGVVAILFINIPGTIYRAFNSNSKVMNNDPGLSWTNEASTNIFFGNTFLTVLSTQIIGFLQVLVFGIAIFFIMLAGIKILSSRGREDEVKESKMKIIYSIMALIFVGLIETWKEFAFDGKIAQGKSFFESLANLSLFLSAPIAIFFLTLAAYYYITSVGDEEKLKKAKSIVVNTVIATVLLLSAYTFLLDLADL